MKKYEEETLLEILEKEYISLDDKLTPYFQKQLEKGFRKYKTNDLSYCTENELKTHLLEEVVDAIVYTHFLTKEWESKKLESKKNQLLQLARLLVDSMKEEK